jgi:transcriptional regulator with GAF, ATPase, and Fis domain
MSRLYVHSIHLFLSIALVYIAYNAQIIGVKQEYFFIFSLVLIPLLLPVVDHITRSIEKIFGSSITPDAYIDTIDTIIQLNSIDELLNTQFNQILRLLGLHEGTMIFHDREREEYTIFLKTIEPDSMTKKGTLDSENILIKILNSPEDIILKSRISGHLSIERNLINLMEMYKAEIIIPMYFSGMLTGAMLLGKKSSDYNNDEISALKIFASKIASLSINSMFWKELVRKRELEKEKRMELRVQKAFLPAEKLITENVEIAVF